MKTIWLAALLAIPAQAQNVFLLGSNTALPPDLNGNVQAVAAAPAVQAPVTVNVNVNAAATPNCTYPATYAYPPQYYNTYYPQYSPNVMYVGGPGTCGPNYYSGCGGYYNNYYPNCAGSSVIYFGGLQACREGYNFRHRR